MSTDAWERSRAIAADYQAWHDETHNDCSTCKSAHGKESMCPAGRARYVQMLNEMENLFVEQGRARVGTPQGKRFLFCVQCGRRHEVPADVLPAVWLCEHCKGRPAEPPAYVCPRCGRASWNPHDGEHRYCANCGRFEDESLNG